MLRLTEEEYEELRKAVVGAATGSGGLTPKSATKRSSGIDSNGDRVVMSQVQEVDAPDIKLAMSILDARIGGPQDYC